MKYYIRKNGKRIEVTKEKYFELFPPVDVAPEETENVSRETIEETETKTTRKKTE